MKFKNISYHVIMGENIVHCKTLTESDLRIIIHHLKQDEVNIWIWGLWLTCYNKPIVEIGETILWGWWHEVSYLNPQFWVISDHIKCTWHMGLTTSGFILISGIGKQEFDCFKVIPMHDINLFTDWFRPDLICHTIEAYALYQR